MPAVNNVSKEKNANISPGVGIQKKVIQKMDKETMDEKLSKLRSKFGKCPKENQKKAPIIVAAHHDVAPVKTKKEGVIHAEAVMNRLK